MKMSLYVISVFSFYITFFILINNCTPVVLYKIIQIDACVFF